VRSYELLRISHFLIIRQIRTTWSWDQVCNFIGCLQKESTRSQH